MSKNVKEKLEKILRYIATDTKPHALDLVLSSQVKNLYFIVSGIQSYVKQDAPIISKLIATGI